MKQLAYMLAAIGICAAMSPVLLTTVVYTWVMDALDTAVMAWKECEKL